MNRIIVPIFLFSFLLVTAIGCGCPPDEKVGEIGLQPATLGWIAYQGNEQLRYVNLTGDTLFLRNRNGVEQQQDQLCVRTICTENQIKGESFCEYFDAESRRFIFQDDADSILLDLLFYSAVYDGDSRRFVDIGRASVSWGTPSISGERILAQHFQGGLDTTRLSLLPEWEFLGKVKLGTEYFDEVYSVVNANMALWISPQQGLVGFSRGGDLYRLDQVN